MKRQRGFLAAAFFLIILGMSRKSRYPRETSRSRKTREKTILLPLVLPSLPFCG